MQDAEPPAETRAPEPEPAAYELPPLVLGSLPEQEQPVAPPVPQPPPAPPLSMIEAPKSSAELIAPTVVATAPPPPPAPPPVQPAQAAPPAAAPPLLEKGRWWTVCSHLMLFAAIPTIFLGGVVTFFLWQILGKEDPFVEDQAREALNFQINIALLSLVLMASIFGLPLVIVLWIVACIMCLIAARHAARGERYRYPLIFRVVTH
jgi:uncharacterized protein